MNQIKADNAELAKDLKKDVAEMKASAIDHTGKRSFADVPGNSASFVVPMKKAIKEIKIRGSHSSKKCCHPWIDFEWRK